MASATLFIIVLVLLALVFVAIRTIQDKPDRDELARLRNREQDYQKTSEERDAKARDIELLQIEKAKLEADLENEKKSTVEKIELLQESEARLKTEFENLANRIFEDKGRTLTEQNRERISSLLEPFKEQLLSFRTRVDEVHQNDTERSARLLEQVRQLHELSNKVSEQANNLAKAIKGDTKKQGDWGELIVERIFEASGLERGREFDSQVGIRTIDGSLKKPDFIVYLPGRKAVIVDSKVSLTAYERFSSSEEEKEQTTAIKDHLQSVRKHVEELQAKDYSQLLGNRTLDFVIMCIPIEPAYLTALQNDKNLVYDLAKTNVVITGPNTLMITLKLIAQIWRRENENRNAEKIAARAGRMYDQVVLIVEAMADAQRKLTGVSESFETAVRRLQTGRGNLVGRVDEMRKLGAKVKKQLPAEILDEATAEEPGEDS